jgi:hypothetical protein
MHIQKTMNLAFSLILLGGLLAACGGAAPTSSAAEIATMVAGTFQALTPPAANTQPAGDTPLAPAATEVPTSTLLSTAIPVQVLPLGSFAPYPADACERMRASFEQAIGAPVTVESVPFSDRVTGGTGTACRIHATGNGATYGMPGPFGTLDALVRSLGWTEDGTNYGAGGPTGMADGYRKGGVLGLLAVNWKPSADANCPSNQPIGACSLTPEQKLFNVTFDLAQAVVYQNLAADACAGWLTSLQPAVKVPLVPETVDFTDLEGNLGTACQVRGAGNGLNFNTLADASNAIGQVFASLGWTLVNGADGPTGTLREYSSGNQTAVVTVTWHPSADANCPTDQPISSCSLTPEQRLYSLTAAFAQK